MIHFKISKFRDGPEYLSPYTKALVNVDCDHALEQWDMIAHCLCVADRLINAHCLPLDGVLNNSSP